MAVRKEIGDRVVVVAGKTYTLGESVRDIAGQESKGVERLMSEVMEEAIRELKEDERIINTSSGFFTKNMTTHFWVVVIAQKEGNEGSNSALTACATAEG